MVNHVSELRENWLSESISRVKLFLLCLSYLLTSLGEIRYRKPHHMANHVFELRENWLSESISRVKLFLLCLSYFLTSLGEIRYRKSRLVKRLIIFLNIVKIGSVKSIFYLSAYI